MPICQTQILSHFQVSSKFKSNLAINRIGNSMRAKVYILPKMSRSLLEVQPRTRPRQRQHKKQQNTATLRQKRPTQTLKHQLERLMLIHLLHQARQAASLFPARLELQSLWIKSKSSLKWSKNFWQKKRKRKNKKVSTQPKPQPRQKSEKVESFLFANEI